MTDVHAAGAELVSATADAATSSEVRQRRADLLRRCHHKLWTAVAIATIAALVVGIAIMAHGGTRRVTVTGVPVTRGVLPQAPACDSGLLAVTAGPVDVGGPQIGFPLAFENVSSSPCRIDGPLGVQLGDAAGKVVLSAAAPNPGSAAVTVSPAATATADVGWTLYGWNGMKWPCSAKDMVAITTVVVTVPGDPRPQRINAPRPAPELCPDDREVSVTPVEAPLRSPPRSLTKRSRLPGTAPDAGLLPVGVGDSVSAHSWAHTDLTSV